MVTARALRTLAAGVVAAGACAAIPSQVAVAASGPRLVRDISPGNGSSNIDNLSTVNGRLVFDLDGNLDVRADNGDVTTLIKSAPRPLLPVPGGAVTITNAGDLWRTDGTVQGTEDLGIHASDRLAPVYANGLIYFMSCANNTLCSQAQHLWVTDGTPAGTHEVGPRVKPAFEMAAYDGNVYFPQFRGSAGFELWRTDGTDAGTHRVRDIWPGKGFSYPRMLTVVGNLLYFTADDGTHGRELWRSDGTKAGTFMVGDLAPGAASSNPHQITDVDGVAYFVAKDGANARRLWRSDGSVAGTRRVQGSVPFSAPAALTAVADRLWFSAVSTGEGREPFVSDGSVSGTHLVRDLAGGSASSSPTRFTSFNGKVLFAASTASGRELWQSDGTSAGTTLVDDIFPGDGSSYPTDFAGVGSDLFFVAYEPLHGRELRVLHDGAVGLANDFNTSPLSSDINFAGVVGGHVCFSATPTGRVREGSMWSTDGTTAGTVSLGVPLTTYDDFLYGRHVDVSAAGSLYLLSHPATPEQPGHYEESDLVRTDCATRAGTTVVRALPRAQGRYTQISSAGGRVYVVVREPDGARDLAGFRGSTYLGTERLAATTAQMTPAGNRLYISDPQGPGLWQVDSGVDVTPVVPGVFGHVRVGTVVPIGPRLVVEGFDESDGSSVMMVTDGTAAGTRTLMSATSGFIPGVIATATRAYYFVGTGSGVELWATDGSADGTTRVRSFTAPLARTYPSTITVGDRLLFLIQDANDVELWATDGTDDGTVLLGTFGNVDMGSAAAGLLLFDSRPGQDATGCEVWESDGTSTGTKQISAKSCYPSQATAVTTNVIAFAGLYPFHGEALWQTDGTDDGTQVVDADSPDIGFAVDGTLYYDATTPDTGDELWAWTP